MRPAQLRDEMLMNAGINVWKKGEAKDIIVEDRGRIIPVADGEFRSVMIIESKKGAVRANHWHKSDSHVMWILSGEARYVETHMDEAAGIVRDMILGPGDSVLTEPLVPHAMKFLKDTVMIVCAKNDRDTETYLNDIVKCSIL